jgi:hypothetical protein
MTSGFAEMPHGPRVMTDKTRSEHYASACGRIETKPPRASGHQSASRLMSTRPNALLVPKFVIKSAAMDHELRKTGH